MPILYRWCEGESVREYADSAHAWAAHTADSAFAARFSSVVHEAGLTNEQRSDRVEAFLLEEAVAAGVVRKVEVRPGRNPNWWGKRLAPWFTDTCREARRAWRDAR